MRSRFSPLAMAGFEAFFLPWMRRRVRVRITGLPARLPADRPLLLAANHVSAWDGFVLRQVQRMVRPRAPLFTVASRAELARHPFLRRLGAVGIDPASPASVARGLELLSAELSRRPDAVVAFFPQGRIWPSHRRPLGFRRGVELFARRLQPLVLPVALHVEPLNGWAPTHFVSVGEPVDPSAPAQVLERAVGRQLDALYAFLGTHGEDAPAAWPGPHGELEAA